MQNIPTIEFLVKFCIKKVQLARRFDWLLNGTAPPLLCIDVNTIDYVGSYFTMQYLIDETLKVQDSLK